MGGWFNLNEVQIRRKRGDNTRSSLNIGLVLLRTPSILSHVGAKLALLARRSAKIVVGRNYAKAKTGIFSSLHASMSILQVFFIRTNYIRTLGFKCLKVKNMLRKWQGFVAFFQKHKAKRVKHSVKIVFEKSMNYYFKHL